eukprot:TRINITY_DN32767_c0_g1_i1.p1 TRINITY_DN32767_c0_g1~~TRINITY_DN32767_c0_g1_i1.p1  ORF type:complete len:265 (+),score=46.27 TRINITY_DN32767_c0_g1_i1:24-797(+)
MDTYRTLKVSLPNGVVLRVASEAAALEEEELNRAVKDRVLRGQVQTVQKIEKREADFGGWTGEIVWEAAQALVNLISREPKWVEGKRVLELGSGCALLGLAAAALGAREVILTDQVIYMAEYNLKSNFRDQPELRERVQARQLNWGDASQTDAMAPPYELLLGADLMYDESLYSVLADTLIRLSGPGTVILWATPHSPSDHRCNVTFYRRLMDHGFIVCDISGRPAADQALRAAPDPYPRGKLSIIEMQLPKASSRL